MSLIKSTATIGVYTLISRLLGFFRDVTIASSLGASWLSDAFFVAFKIPNFMRRLFAEGAFNSAFVPLYAGTLAEENGRAKAALFADEAYSFLLAVLLLFSSVFILAMPWLMWILAPGFTDNPQKYTLTVLLTRITMPYIIFISIVSLLGGMLNSVGRFAAVAATPIIMNICLIIIPPMINRFVPTGAHALAIAVLISGVAQMLWLMVWCKRLNIMPTLRPPRLTAEVKRLLKLIAPAAMGAGVAQINLFVDLIIASQISNGVSYLYYADRISELPLAVIGIAIGTALLPLLSRHIREGKHASAHASQNRAIELALLLALPAAAALMTISIPVIQVLYERGAFTVDDTRKTASALIAFAAGLPAFVLVKVLGPAFYANRDTKTPFQIALICISVNFLLNITLIYPFAHVGMAIATAIAAWLNVALMMRILLKRGMFVWDRLLLARLPRMLVAAGLMSVTLWYFSAPLAHWLVGSTIARFVALSILVTIGLVVYGAAALMLRAVDVPQFRRLMRKAK